MSTYQKTKAAASSAREGITVRYTAKTPTSGGRRGGDSHLGLRRNTYKGAYDVSGGSSDQDHAVAAAGAAAF